ncbi:MAG TPA: hypothetical protein VH143_31580 [Kofleriaceae bacterium]|nr:hypothetical protein [Kofleriaceae bacterium]
MRSIVLVALASVAAGCGYQIGESCIVDTDCSADGSRVCDETEPSGYCTIIGCDYNTCPENSECVRFYTGSFANEPCDYQMEDNGANACSYDEECSLAGQCVPRAAEIRYCMANCSTSGDCRDGYECRNYNTAPGSDTTFQAGTMQEDGGEVVLAPGDKDEPGTTGFCAPTQASGS